jgi:TrpR-related protein YerC/YecD
MTEKSKTQQRRELYRAILSLKDLDECERFFEDLCTPAELTALSDRWRVAKLLGDGVPYREIYERTGVSTATVTRVARALTYGEGYRVVLGRGKTEKERG